MTRQLRRLAAIVSMDAVGYSRLMGRDETATLAAFKAHRRELIDPKIAEHGGRIVKTMGDGLLVEFASVVDAVRCSVDVQRAMIERNAAVPPDEQIVFRFGINVGDIIIDGEDIFGDGVNVAARLQGLAEPGGICVSRAVRDQVLDKLDFAFEDLGSKEMKNIARPVEIYRVALSGAAPRAVRDRRHEPSLASDRPSSRLRLLGMGALVIALAAAGWFTAQEWLRPADVVAYSAQDRRMTFAVLPFTAPAGDAQAASLAVAMTEAVQADQEANKLWAVVVARSAVDLALTKHATTQDLATALNVHFLIRGHVARTPTAGHALELRVVDGSTERVLETRALAVVAGALSPRTRDELGDALGWMTYKALQVEVDRARDKPLESLDVRDLTFRAYADWGKQREQDGKLAHTSATQLLNRALALAPDDALALYVTAAVNLCDCVEGWSRNVAEQQAVGAAALEKFLRRNPESSSGLNLKANLFALRGQYEEALVIVDSILKREPENSYTLHTRAFALLRVGKPRDALVTVNHLLEFRDDADVQMIASAVHYALGNDELAASHAQKGAAQMSPEELRNGNRGAIVLTWIAAEGRLGRKARARTALATFHTAVPEVTTVSGMRAWMKPNAELADHEPLFDGLRRAGVPE